MRQAFAGPVWPCPTWCTSTRTRRLTPAGDMGETKAVARLFGDQTVVTATKVDDRHLIGAAGAVESIATLLAVRDDIVPATITCSTPTRNCASTYRPGPLDDRPGGNLQLLRLRRAQRRRCCSEGLTDDAHTKTRPSPSTSMSVTRSCACPSCSIRARWWPCTSATRVACFAVRGTINGAGGHRLLHGRHGHGRGDGGGGLPLHRRRDRHGGARTGARHRPVALRGRSPRGRRRGAGRGGAGLRGDDPGVGTGAADLGGARPGRGRRRLRPGAHRSGDHVGERSGVRHRPGRRAHASHRRERRHGVPRRRRNTHGRRSGVVHITTDTDDSALDTARVVNPGLFRPAGHVRPARRRPGP